MLQRVKDLIAKIRVRHADLCRIPQAFARLQKTESELHTTEYRIEQLEISEPQVVARMEVLERNVEALEQRLDSLIKKYTVTVGHLDLLQTEHEIHHPKRRAWVGAR